MDANKAPNFFHHVGPETIDRIKYLLLDKHNNFHNWSFNNLHSGLPLRWEPVNDVAGDKFLFSL